MAACSSGNSDGSSGTSGSATTGSATTGTSGSATTGSDGGTTGTSGSATTGTSGGTVADAGPDSTTSTTNCIWTFDDPDAGAQGWVFNPYQTPADPNPNDADGVDFSNLSAAATINQDNLGGFPAPPNGELTIFAPFNAYTPPFGQKVDIHNVSLPVAAMDLSNSTITMRLKLDPSPDGGVAFSPSANAPGGIVMYVKSAPNFVYAQNTYTNINSANPNWIEYTFDVPFGVDAKDSPNYLDGGFNATQIVEIGFSLDTGSGGLALADGGPPNTAPPTPATFHVDSICLIPAQ